MARKLSITSLVTSASPRLQSNFKSNLKMYHYRSSSINSVLRCFSSKFSRPSSSFYSTLSYSSSRNNTDKEARGRTCAPRNRTYKMHRLSRTGEVVASRSQQTQRFRCNDGLYVAGGLNYPSPIFQRSYHKSHNHAHQAPVPSFDLPPEESPLLYERPISIREKLQKWKEQDKQVESDILKEDEILAAFSGVPILSDNLNDETGRVAGMDSEMSEIANFDTIEDLNSLSGHLNPGDLVNLMDGAESIIAVFVREFASRAQYFTITGKWMHKPVKNADFVVHNFVDPVLIDNILPYLPTDDVSLTTIEKVNQNNMDLSVPREVSGPVLQKMIQFSQLAEETYRKYARVLDDAYNLLSHKENTHIWTLHQITRKLLGEYLTDSEIEPHILYAVRKSLNRAGYGISYDARHHRITSAFIIRPRSDVESIEKVRTWIREYQDFLAWTKSNPNITFKRAPPYVRSRFPGAGVIESFVEKSRTLIEKSRLMRNPTPYGSVGPSKIQHPIEGTSSALRHIVQNQAFSNNDELIIRYLEGWALSNKFLRHPQLKALAPVIIRAVGAYDDLLEHHGLDTPMGFQFLQEIGVIAPYENRAAYDEFLMLPTYQFSKQVEILDSRARQAKLEVKFNDSMALLRKDWGDMDVFCIDDGDAREIDDGISVERIPDEPSNHWVHVHVANPTAFLSRDTLFSSLAQHMTETVYFPERTYPMLPSWTSSHFSVAPGKAVLTFSAKLDGEGNILATKVQPGKVRQVTCITPNTLATHLGYDGLERDAVYLNVGGEVPEVSQRPWMKTQIVGKQLEDLKLLDLIAAARLRNRRKAGGLFFDQYFPEMSTFETPRRGLAYTRPWRYHSRIVEGDPIIQMQTKKFRNWFGTNEKVDCYLVQEMMLLACEVAASWCAQRDVPIIYRGTIRNPNRGSVERFEEEVYKPALDSQGIPPLHVGTEYLKMLGNTIASSKPLAHSFLGLQHYSKVTSPLRRYGDMVTHWQIEAALRHEAGFGEAGTTNGMPSFPFSRAEIDGMLQWLQPREKLITKSKRMSESFWLCQLFFRALYFKETELPETFKCVVYNRNIIDNSVTVICDAWSFDLDMHDPEPMGLGRAEVGDWWEAKLEFVSPYYKRLASRPVRLLSRYEGR